MRRHYPYLSSFSKLLSLSEKRSLLWVLILGVVLSVWVPTDGQSGCDPVSLPYFEDFEGAGFHFFNGLGGSSWDSTGNKNRAATVEDLLAMFRLLDKSLGVVMLDGWELLDFEPNQDGSIFQYDDEDDYCLFRLGGDVRLLTTEQLERDLKEKGLDKCLDFRVAAASRKLKMAYRMNCVRRNYGKLCLCYCDDEEEQSITQASLLEEFPDCAEFMILLDGKYYTVDVDENGIFFYFNNEEGKHLGLYLGEVVYDSRAWELE